MMKKLITLLSLFCCGAASSTDEEVKKNYRIESNIHLQADDDGTLYYANIDISLVIKRNVLGNVESVSIDESLYEYCYDELGEEMEMMTKDDFEGLRFRKYNHTGPLSIKDYRAEHLQDIVDDFIHNYNVPITDELVEQTNISKPKMNEKAHTRLWYRASNIYLRKLDGQWIRDKRKEKDAQ
jgi:hypothetical protein